MNNWTDTVKLITILKEKDSAGFKANKKEEGLEIIVNFIGVTRKEEEHANQLGYTADLSLEIMTANYENQELLKDVITGKEYRIKRVYPKSSEILILTCSDLSKGE